MFLLTGAVNGTAGASGAIFGLLGALIVSFRRARMDMRQLIVVLAINLWISFQFSGISWQGHVGGLVIGAAVTAAMVYPPAKVRTAWQVGASVGVLVLLGALVAARFGNVQPLECLFVNGGLQLLRGLRPGNSGRGAVLPRRGHSVLPRRGHSVLIMVICTRHADKFATRRKNRCRSP